MARRSLERFRRVAEHQQTEVPPPGEGDQPVARRRKKMSDQTKILIGALALLFAGVVLLVVWRGIREEEEKVEIRKRTVIGERGRASLDFKLERTEGIVNLPVAQDAKDLEDTGTRVVEVRYEWRNDKTLARQELTRQFRDIAAKLTRAEGMLVYEEPVTLKVDRDLEYRFLGLAFVVGRDEGFINYHIACLKKGTGTDVGALKVVLPPPGLKTFLFRMYQQGERMTYVFGKSVVEKIDNLWDATGYLKAAHARQPDMVVEIAPTVSVTVQHFVEGLNSVAAAGFKKIVLGYTAGIE